MLDQQKFVETDDFDIDDVKLEDAPQTVEHYLKQVKVDRSRHADVVTVEIDTRKFRSLQTISMKEDQTVTNASCSYVTPPMAWQNRQVAEFSDLRLKLANVKVDLKNRGRLPKIEFPDSDEEDDWKAMCFPSNQQHDAPTPDVKDSAVEEEEESAKRAAPVASPPLTTVVLSMSQPEAVELFEFQVQWFEAEGYSKERMRWLFALLCVLEKPLDPDCCSALRNLARQCARCRAAMDSAGDSSIIQRELSWFIAIVARYFDQNDLADR